MDSQPNSASLDQLQDVQTSLANDIIFVDTGLADYQTLVHGLPDSAQVVLLDAHQDGLTQMAAYLEGKNGINAIHVLSHGAAGRLRLGGLTLDAASLDTHAAELTAIGRGLAQDGDILLYGCNVAAGATGVEFIGKLAQATGADVAASDDLTGAAGKGGDWALEHENGSIEAALPLMADAAQSYTQVLATFDLTNGSGNGTKVITETVGSDQIVITAKDADWLFGDEISEVLFADFPNVSGQVALVAGGTAYESEVAITVTGGKIFDLASFSIVAVGTDDELKNLTITTDKGSETTTQAFINNGYGSYYWDVSFSGAIYQGVSWAKITTPANDNGGYSWAFDNIVLNNIAAPNISIDDVSITEGNSGTKTMAFTVSLSFAAPVGGVTFDIATADNAAKAGSDYVVNSLTAQTIAAGSSSYTFDVTLNGDTVIEGNETFFVNLTNVIGATVTAGVGTGTITNDDVNTAPTIALDNATHSYTENASAIQIDATGTVSDADGDADWDGGKLDVQITSGAIASDEISISDTDGDGTAITVSGTDIFAGGVDVGDLSVSGGAVTGGTKLTITFDSDATNAIVQETLQSLRYRNTGDDPGNTNRVVTVTATDAHAGASSDTRTIAITPVNDDPTISGLPASVTVTEDTSSNVDLSAATFDDVDSGADSVNMLLAAGAGTLAAASGGGVTIGGSGSGNLILTGTAASIDSYLNTVSNIQYTGAANASGNNVTTLNLTANDGGGNVSLGTVNANITPANDAPVLDNSGAMTLASVTEDATAPAGDTVAAIIASTGSDRIADVDSGAVEGMAITGLTGDGTWQYNTGAGWTAVGAVSGNSALLLASANALRFVPTAANNDAQTATVTFCAWDQTSGTAGNKTDTTTNGGTTSFSTATETAEISVTAVNDEPTLTATGGNPTYLPGGSASALFSGASINPIEAGQNITQMVLTVTNVMDGASEMLVVDGSTVALTNGTTTAGSFDYTVSVAASTATVTLTKTDTAANWQTLVNGLQYQNTSSTPTTGSDRVVTLTGITDNGGTAGGGDDTAAVSVASTVSFGMPSITSATYDCSTGQLILTGTNFVALSGATNDVIANLLTITGEGGASYTLTDTANVEITSSTSATLSLSATDKLNIHGLLNKNGAASGDVTTYNVAAADNWLAGSPSGLDISDALAGVTVNNVATPTITSATYDSATGVLTVTGSNLFRKPGADNDIDVSTFTITGTGGSYTLTSLSDVEITSATSFTVTLTGADKTQVDTRLDQTGTQSSSAITYNLAAAEDWARGADAPVNIADTTGNGITVTANTAPVITGGDTAAVSVAENTTAVTMVTATDVDAGQTITYSLNGGADAAKFDIVGATGVLTFKTAPDFENPTDLGDTADNNTYVIEVQADDGNGGTDTQTITVTVTDVNEAPTVTSGETGTVAENAPISTVIYTATATDPDAGQTPTYTLTGADAGLLNIDANTGAVTLKNPADFETKNAYGFNVVVTDNGAGNLTDAQAVTVNVTDVNETSGPPLPDPDPNPQPDPDPNPQPDPDPNPQPDPDPNPQPDPDPNPQPDPDPNPQPDPDPNPQPDPDPNPQPDPDPNPQPDPDPNPQPGPGMPPEDTWDDLPDNDGDGIPEIVENFVPGVDDGAQGDGNGDGVQDTLQPNVSSVPFRDTSHVSQEPDAEQVFVTLTATSNAQNALRNVHQQDAPDDLPEGVDMPLGLIAFEADVAVGVTETFSLFVEAKDAFNGYFKQNAAGDWVNIATAITVDEKVRIDFAITDGGEFDADGIANGVIVDPGATGFASGTPSQTLSEVLGVVATLFDATPGAVHLDGFLDSLSASYGLRELTRDLLQTNVFQGILGNQPGNPQFTSLALQHLGLEDNALAIDYFATRLNRGDLKENIILEAVQYLLGDEVLPSVQSAADSMRDKIIVSQYASNILALGDTDLDPLQKVLADMDTDSISERIGDLGQNAIVTTLSSARPKASGTSGQEDVLHFDLELALGASTDCTLSFEDFIAEEDRVVIDIAAGGTGPITVTVDEANNQLSADFGPNAVGRPCTLTLIGVTDVESIEVVFI